VEREAASSLLLLGAATRSATRKSAASKEKVIARKGSGSRARQKRARAQGKP
jgi:hypothetical protein